MGPYPLSALPFDLGFTLLALALWRYAGLLAPLLRMLKKPRVDHFLSIAAFLLLVAVGLHVYASVAVLPLLEQAAPEAFDAVYARAMGIRNLSLGMLVASGFLSALTGGLYYRWISR